MPASNPNRTADPRVHGLRTLAGVMVAGLLMGSMASRTEAAAEAKAPPAKVAATVPATSTVKPVVKPAPAATNAVATSAKSVPTVSKSTPTPTPTTATATPKPKPVSTAKVSTAAPGGAATARKAAPAVGSAIVQSSAHLDEQLTYQYNALGRRDPFQSLLTGEYVGADVGGDAPPDVGGIKVVGIVWGDADQFALVEDARGESHIMRRGDKVMNGFVEALKREAMIVNLTIDGQSQSVTVPLTRKGEKTNANH